ncbi:MAG: tetratricopeptide repeat protein [Armatimonadetes bacterium]|nr:tetratricopeptide repeat protein [Anaerolineae bacterium]
MSQNSTEALIGKAWQTHQAGRNADAIREFEQLVSANPENVDAYYGLGLAQRASGQPAAAQASWERALMLATTKLDAIRGIHKNEHNAETLDDDRYMMLIRMISQRIEEVSVQRPV